MVAEKALIDLLLASAGVTALVSDRIYLSEAPRGVAVPFVLLTRVSSQQQHSLNSVNGLVKALVRVMVYGTTTKQVRDVGAAVRGVLDAFRGVQSGVNLQAVLCMEEFDDYDDVPEYRVLTQDFRVWYID